MRTGCILTSEVLHSLAGIGGAILQWWAVMERRFALHYLKKKTPNIRCPTTLEPTTVAQTSSRYKPAPAVLSCNWRISGAACSLTMRHDDLAMIPVRYAAVTVRLRRSIIVQSVGAMLHFWERNNWLNILINKRQPWTSCDFIKYNVHDRLLSICGLYFLLAAATRRSAWRSSSLASSPSRDARNLPVWYVDHFGMVCNKPSWCLERMCWKIIFAALAAQSGLDT